MVEVVEGFARIAYDFKVSPVDESCFFNLFETKEKRYLRLSEAFNFKMPKILKDKLF